MGEGVAVSSLRVVPASTQGEEVLCCSTMSPSHGTQFSMSFCSVSPFHRLQLFMSCCCVGDCFISCSPSRGGCSRVPTGSQVLGNLLQCRLLSPWVLRACQETAPARACHGSQPALGASGLGLHSCRWISALPLTSSMGTRGTAASPWASQQAQRNLILPASSFTLVSAVIPLMYACSSLL